MRPVLDSDSVERAVSEHDPSTTAETREALARCQRCLDALDELHRAVFVMFEFEGFKARDIARSLNIPEGTVYSRLHKARQLFRTEYDRLCRG